jgi:hypothetical protein
VYAKEIKEIKEIKEKREKYLILSLHLQKELTIYFEDFFSTFILNFLQKRRFF